MVVPVATLTVGYPSPEAKDDIKAERLPLSAIVHSEKYSDYTPADITAAYAGKEQLEVNRQFVKDNGKQSLAQVFTDVRYPQSTSDTYSRLLRDFIAAQGYAFPE